MSTLIGLRAGARCHTISPLRRECRKSLLRLDASNNGRRTFFGIGEGITYASLALSKKIIWTTIGLNAAVFGAWQYAGRAQQQSMSWNSMWKAAERSTPDKVGKALSDNFILRPDDLARGKFWTSITSAFSHMELYHIAGNMFTFHAFATVLTYSGLPPTALGALMFGSAISGSLGYVYHEKSRNAQRSRMSNVITGGALGASGMVMGLGAAAALTKPFTSLLLMGVIPVPMWAIFAGYTVYDIFYLDRGTSRIGHAAHLGGGVFGVVFYVMCMRALGGPFGL